MDIHRPKPIHALKEFLSEIGVIVCGVIIALGLEQSVEALHWVEKAHAAKAALHKEMVGAHVLAEERFARKACADQSLTELSAAILASPPKWKPRPADYCGAHHISVYHAPDRPWPTEVWKSVVAEGVVSHFDDRYRGKAPFLFDFIQSMATLNAAEVDQATDLNVLSQPIRLTSENKLVLMRELEKLRAQNDTMATSSAQVQAQIRDIGEAPSEAELAQVRAIVPNFYISHRTDDSGVVASATASVP